MSTKKLVTMAVLSALAVVLVGFIHFPLFATAPFLEYDPADIPILIGTLAFGPVSGLLLTLVAAVLQGVTVSAQSGLYGIIMHILATGTYVLVVGSIYRRKKTAISVGIGLICGTVAMTVVMVGANLLVTPIFMGTTIEVVKGMILPAIVPFNLLKAGINGVITFGIYMAISGTIRKFDA